MPASAVASRTPEIAGVSGTWCGARGEIAVDMSNVCKTTMPGTRPGITHSFDKYDRFYFLSGAGAAAGAAGGSVVYIFSILALARSDVTSSACALRVTYCSI